MPAPTASSSRPTPSHSSTRRPTAVSATSIASRPTLSDSADEARSAIVDREFVVRVFGDQEVITED
jgi:hypothetical protein